ncbi:hypothetical protein Pmani_018144 [Petrolisthes manimaculis]|uniref:Uncharacterized protein n=1 Tax=Petrolisthes manimaculis TaxID=1843537 RepID=A0AAE1U706_9EUCA|nr:hypothetical protein Pmani_018144 [Petrolisthes manimaculis]
MMTSHFTQVHIWFPSFQGEVEVEDNGFQHQFQQPHQTTVVLFVSSPQDWNHHYRCYQPRITEGWVDLVIDFIHLILASILLHGVRTDRITLLWTWVLGTGTLVIISIIVGIVIIILTNSILGAILLLVVSACQSYFILVVRSYAIQLAMEATTTGSLP